MSKENWREIASTGPYYAAELSSDGRMLQGNGSRDRDWDLDFYAAALRTNMRPVSAG